MQGLRHVVCIVGVCSLCQVFLAIIFSGSGFGGVWAFYSVPSVVFAIIFFAAAIKILTNTKWLVGNPKYWVSILLGALLSGCALGFHWPVVSQFRATPKIASVSEYQDDLDSIEFINGVVPIIPAVVTSTTIDVLGVHQQEFEARNTGSGNIPEKCFIAVGLGDLALAKEPPAGFSLTVGVSCEGKCTDEAVVETCLAELRSECSPCNPRGAVPLDQVPWHMGMGPGFPQEAIDDFKAKNSISAHGFSHVNFYNFENTIKNGESIMVGCAVSGVVLTILMAGAFAMRDRAKVMQEQAKMQNEEQ